MNSAVSFLCANPAHRPSDDVARPVVRHRGALASCPLRDAVDHDWRPMSPALSSWPLALDDAGREFSSSSAATIGAPATLVTGVASGQEVEAVPLDEPIDPVAEMRRVLRERTEAWELAQSDRDSTAPHPWQLTARRLRARTWAAFGKGNEREKD